MGKELRKKRIFKVLHWVCYAPPWIVIIVLGMSVGITKKLLWGIVILGGVMAVDWISSYYHSRSSSPE